MTRVLLAEDYQLVREGLVYFLSTQPGLEVVGQAETGLEAVRLADDTQPDVILMDLVLPELDGISAIHEIRARHPDIEILVLTSFIDDQKVRDAIQAGAAGYLMKDVSPAELARAIRAAARGEVYLHPEAARRLALSLRPQTSGGNEPPPEVLTQRECDVLCLIARGLSNQDIADDLNISLTTVKAHVSSVLQKLALDSRVKAALYALRHDLVSLDDRR